MDSCRGNSSRGIPDCFQQMPLLPFYLLGKGKAPRLEWLAASWRGLLSLTYWPPLHLFKKQKDAPLTVFLYDHRLYSSGFFSWQGSTRKAIAEGGTSSFSQELFLFLVVLLQCYYRCIHLCFRMSPSVLARRAYSDCCCEGLSKIIVSCMTLCPAGDSWSQVVPW